MLSPTASVSWIVARLAYAGGEARGASNIGGLQTPSEGRGRILSKAAASGKGIRRGILGVVVR